MTDAVTSARARTARDALAVLTDGVDALADLGSDDALAVLQECARAASAGPDPVLVEVSDVLLLAHQRAAADRRAERRRGQLRSAVAEVVEAAVKDRDVDLVLSAAVGALRRVMSCQGASIRAFDIAGSTAGAQPYAASHPAHVEAWLTDGVIEIASRAAEVCWERQTAYLMHVDDPHIAPLTSPQSHDFAVDFMRRVGARELLMAPLGAAGKCQGWIALSRSEVHEPFGDDDVEAVLAIGREVGNVVRHARAFRRQQELIARLRDLSHHKSRFTATVAHQLRNPLTSVLLALEELTPPLAGDDDAARTSLAAISRSAHTIETSIESLLALARLEETPALAPTRVDLHHLVMESVSDSDSMAEVAGVTVDSSRVEPGLHVSAEAVDLEMVVDNLIGNAIKYSPDGGEVRLSLTRRGDEVLFSCIDHGIGMDEADLAQLFTAFHRSPDAQRRRIPGTGLGMAIVKAAVDRHQGRVEASSVPGGGTRLDVWLPSAP